MHNSLHSNSFFESVCEVIGRVMILPSNDRTCDLANELRLYIMVISWVRSRTMRALLSRPRRRYTN